MRYFVTGATGFIGRHLCAHLVAEGHEVHALVRTPSKRSVLPSSVHCVAGDLASFQSREFEIPEVDVVVHLAGTVAATSDEEYRQVNYGCLVDLVRYLESRPWTPKRMLFASSLAAAGPSEPGSPHDESCALLPIEAYGQAKADSEAFLMQTAIPVTAFRPPLVFGAEDSATWTLYETAQRGFGFVIGSEPQELSFVDVRDLVRALVLMAEEDVDGFQAYFTSYPQPIDSAEIWTTIGAALGKSLRVVPVPRFALHAAMRMSGLLARMIPAASVLDEKQYRQMVAPAFACSSDRLQERLGWEPRYDFSASVRDAVDGYRDRGWL